MKIGDAVCYVGNSAFKGIVAKTVPGYGPDYFSVRLVDPGPLGPNYVFHKRNLKVVEECDPAYAEVEAA